MALKTTRWDPADYLDSPESIAAYIEAAMEDGDPALIAAAIGDIARARGMTEVAKKSGFTREALYRSLSEDGHPEFITVVKVLDALGVRLAAVPKEAA
jgi:probable addiction module antidote protein